MKKLIYFFLLVNTFFVNSQIKLNSLFSDNMVLQRNSDVNIWGKSGSNQLVKINSSWEDKTYKIKSDINGYWKIKVKTNFKKGPQTLSIKTKNDIKTIKNILLGEVWFGSGQSNMEMPLSGFQNEPVFGSQEIIAKSKNDLVRLITVPKKASEVPLENFDGFWEISSPESVRDFSAVAYIFASYVSEVLNVPVGIIHTSWGGTPAEAWTDKEFLESNFSSDLIKNHSRNKLKNHEPSFLFNGMINPLIPYTIKGAIWYQGENNRNRSSFYAELMKIMVESWRTNWDQGDFYFFYAQIAPFKYEGKDKKSSALLREAQLNAMDLIRNSGMAVTSDIGDLNSIHPSEKIKVGKRLAYWALNNTYSINSIVPSGPIIKSYQVNGSKVELTFDYAKNGFYEFNGPLKDFEISGIDGIFHQAKASITWNGRVIVESSEVNEPSMIRYGWKNYFDSTLFNLEGLPASSFFIRDLSKN